jgi:hypothetical protein
VSIAPALLSFSSGCTETMISVMFSRQEPARVEHIKQHHGRDDHPAVKIVCGDSSGRMGQRLAMRTY